MSSRSRRDSSSASKPVRELPSRDKRGHRDEFNDYQALELQRIWYVLNYNNAQINT